MPFRAVVFDLFGTLLEVAPAEDYRAMLGRMAAVLGADEEAFARAWLATREQRLLGAFTSLDDNVEAVCAALGVAPRDGHVEKARRVNEAYIGGLLSRFKADALATVLALKARSLRIALMSDCYRSTAEAWPATPLAPHFDAALFSCRLGFRKPAPEFYAAACRALGVGARDCLYVGDGGGGELEGARRAGMTPVLVVNETPDPFLAEGYERGAAHRVRALAEVVALAVGG